MIYLWYTPDLTDPASTPRPLAIWDGRAIRWVRGEPATSGKDHLFMGSILADIPALIEDGVRFNQTGMSAGNVQEREPFMLDRNARVVRVGMRCQFSAGTKWSAVGVVRDVKGHSYSPGSKRVMEARCDNGAADNDCVTNGFTCAAWVESKHIEVLE